MTMSNWPLADRPREKLLSHGANYLSDSELLAIFFQTGIRGKTALDLARELLGEFGSLKKLLNAEPPFFHEKAGIGKAKYAMLKAALELGRRYLEENVKQGDVLSHTQVTKRFLASRLKHYPHEVFACLFLNTQNRVLNFEELFQGTLTETSIYPREVIKRCLANNAAKVILAHNHPSGCASPSQSDQEVTLLLKEALQLVDIQLLDHVIVGGEKHFSFAEAGLL